MAVLGQAVYATPYTFTSLAGHQYLYDGWDGTNSAAQFYWPVSVALDTAGNLYETDGGNNTIRKLTPVGTNWVVTTLAGLAGYSGAADGTGSAARFSLGEGGNGGGLAADSAGNLYVGDSGNNTIRKVTPAGVVTTLAGLAGSSGTNDGTGSAALFNWPVGVAVDHAGSLYVADANNNTIREMKPVGTNWVVTTLAGSAGNSGSADGTNSAALFNYPLGVAVDSTGNLYVADNGNNTIRKMTPAGTNWVVTTLAGLGRQFRNQ